MFDVRSSIISEHADNHLSRDDLREYQPVTTMAGSGSGSDLSSGSRIMCALFLLACTLFAGGCDFAKSGNSGDDSDDTEDCCVVVEPEDRRIGDVESGLLSRINDERMAYDPPRPALQRDPGMDRIVLWHVTRMAERHVLDHTDQNGRAAGDRAQYYGDDPFIRCSEIIQWWGGTPSGSVHYQGYLNSPPHHMAYLEEGIFSLGPTMWAGVAAVAGTGPDGSAFQGRSGSYTGVMFCEAQVTLIIDPFDE